jgi:hypothetical protein
MSPLAAVTHSGPSAIEPVRVTSADEKVGSTHTSAALWRGGHVLSHDEGRCSNKKRKRIRRQQTDLAGQSAATRILIQ